MKSVFKWFVYQIDKGTFDKSQKKIWKIWYQLMAKFWRDREWSFMNYGYSAPNIAPFPLEQEDEKDRPFIGLYHRALNGLHIKGVSILEVGSGRGGGCSYIARYYSPEKIIGLDYSSTAINLSRQFHEGVQNLEFRQGDAEHLPFQNGTFDIVINVESSHCYGDMEKFVSEVARVLKPGGYFSWLDMRSPSQMERIDQLFQGSPFEIVSQDVISEGVVRALDEANERKFNTIAKFKFLKNLFTEFAGMQGSLLYKGLQIGKVVYAHKLLKKPD